MGRYLGVDYGDRRVGFALSDLAGMFARPLEVIQRSARFDQELLGLIAEHEVDRIVLGLPVNMDGTIGPKAKQVQEFGEKLEQLTGLVVETWDERLTTAEALRWLQDSGASRTEKARRTDMMAAQILLQSYLDAKGQGSGKDP